MFLLFSKDSNVVSVKEDVASARLQQSSLGVGERGELNMQAHKI